MIDWNAFKNQMQANPKKMLGYVLGIAACFLVIWFLVVMQADQSGQTVRVDQSGRLDSLRLSLNRSAGDSLSAVGPAGADSPRESSQNSPFANALPTFLILLAAIGGLWYWIKKSGGQPSGGAGAGEIFTHIGTRELTAGRHISVIKLNGEYWVLGSGGQEVTLLHRYEEEAWDGPQGPDTASRQAKGSLFENILMTKKNKNAEGQNGAK